MNATEKQKGYVYALNRKLGREADPKMVDSLSAQQASGWIDSLLDEMSKNGNGKQAAPVAQIPAAIQPAQEKEKPEFNGARFGCVCKLIVQDMPIGDVLKNRDKFLQTARELYELFGLAEQAMTLAPKGPAVAGFKPEGAR